MPAPLTDAPMAEAPMAEAPIAEVPMAEAPMADSPSEDPPSESDPPREPPVILNIEVHSQDQPKAIFAMKSTIRMSKLKKRYCEVHVSINYQKVFAIVTIKILVTEF